MFRNIHVEGVGPIRLDENNDYLAAGGEASIYVKGNTAYKIYRDPSQMIPIEKVKQLHAINDPNVIIPQKLIYDTNMQVIGFTLQYVPNAVPLVKFFSNTYLKKNNIGLVELNKIVLSIQKSVYNIHSAGCLVVDMNDMNILVDKKFKAWFIDVDSYQTPSHLASAIVLSIRDPLAVNKTDFTQLSDWFSFSIISFQLYTGIHPYRSGGHPRYGKSEWQKRMKDGVSVFDPDITFASSFRGFQGVPRNYLEWYKSIFVKGKRLTPPNKNNITDVSMIIPTTQVVNSTTRFNVKSMFTFNEPVSAVYPVFSGYYSITPSAVYVGNVKFLDNSGQIVGIISTKNGVPLIVSKNGNKVDIRQRNGDVVYSGTSTDLMIRSDRLYLAQGSAINEVNFQVIGSRIIGGTHRVASILPNAKMYPGVIYQDILGKSHISIPYNENTCTTIPIPELDNKRVIYSKAERNVVVFIIEEKGQYDRYIFLFDKIFENYSVRKVSDVDATEPNFAVLENGICALLTEDNVIELFVQIDKVTRINNAPVDNGTPLVELGNKICVIDGVHVKYISTK